MAAGAGAGADDNHNLHRQGGVNSDVVGEQEKGCLEVDNTDAGQRPYLAVHNDKEREVDATEAWDF